MAVDIIWGPRFEKWAYPLHDHFTEEEIENINPRALESCFINEKMIAIPMYIDIGLLYFRKDLISQLPSGVEWIHKLKRGLTWDEFIEINKEFKRPNGTFLLAYESLLCIFYETMFNKNIIDIFYADSLELMNDDIKGSFRLLHDMIYKYKITPLVVTEYDEYKCSQFVINNDIPFIRHWPGFPNDIDNFDSENKIEKFDFAPIPVIKRGEEAGIYGGWNLMISKYSKYPEYALKFIKFILKPENQKLLFSESNYLPVNEDVYNDSLFVASNPRLKNMYKIIHNGKHRPYLKEYTRISDILSYYLNLYLKNEIAMQDAIDMANRQINSKQIFIP